MSDSSTLFVSQQQVRPSWTLNGLTWELNLAPTSAGGVINNGYNSGNFQNMPHGAVFTSMVGSSVGPNSCPPMRLAVRSTPTWSSSVPSDDTGGNIQAFSDSLFAVTQSAAFVSAGTNNQLLSNGTSAVVPLVPPGNAFEQGICQLQQIMAKGFLNNNISSGTINNQNSNNTPVTTATLCAPEQKKRDFQYAINENITGPADGRKRRKLSKNSAYSSTNMMMSAENSILPVITQNVPPQVPPLTMYQFAPSQQQLPTHQLHQPPHQFHQPPHQLHQLQHFHQHLQNNTTSTADNCSTLTSCSMSSSLLSEEKSFTSTITGRNSVSVNVAENSVLSPTTTIMSPSDRLARPVPLRPIASKKDRPFTCGNTPCQVAEITTSNLNCPSSSGLPGTLSPLPNMISVNKIKNDTPTPTSPRTPTSVPALIPVSNLNSAGIPVGVAVGRQRYSKQKEHQIPAATTSNFMPFSESYTQQTSIPTMSVETVATCEDIRVSNPSIMAWSPHAPSMPHTIPTHQLSPTTTSACDTRWHPYSGLVEQPMTTMNPFGLQLIRDPVSGQLILLPSNNIDTLHRAIILPNATTTASNYSATTNQVQSFLVSQPQQQPSSLLLDNLVTIVPSIGTTSSSNSTDIHGKQKQNPHTVFKLDDSTMPGLMMPCDLNKSSSVNNVGNAVGQQQFMSASLVQQLSMLGNSNTGISNTNMGIPHHFSTIASTGSVLIQQISGNNGPSVPPLISSHPHVAHMNNSLLISAESAAQSVINTQHFPTTNNSFLINTHQISAENSTIIGQVHQPSNLLQHPIIPHAHDNIAATIIPHQSPSYAVPPLSQTNFIPIQDLPVKQPISVLQDKCITENSYIDDEKGSVDSEVCSLTQCKDKTTISENQKEDEIVIKVDQNSSVQDAGNQTETVIPFQETNNNISNPTSVDNGNSIDNEDDDDDDEGKMVVDETYGLSEGEKSPPEHTIESKSELVRNDCPDFSGLQLLLNGIEQVEHISHDKKEESDASNLSEEEDLFYKREKNTEQSFANTTNITTTKGGTNQIDTVAAEDKIQPVNGLEILCALADQRFQEEEMNKTITPLTQTPQKRKYVKRAHLVTPEKRIKTYGESKKLFYKHKLESSKTHRKLDSEHDQLKIKIEMAKKQKYLRETQRNTVKITPYKKDSALSSPSTISSTSAMWKPSPVFASTTTPSKSPVFESVLSSATSRTNSTNFVRRGPGRPRKNPLDTSSKTYSYKSKCGKLGSNPLGRPRKYKKRLSTEYNEKKYKYFQNRMESLKLTKNGELSPPILKPMPSSASNQKLDKISTSPPTLSAKTHHSYFNSKGNSSYSNQSSGDNSFNNTKKMPKYGQSSFVTSSIQCYSDDESDDKSSEKSRSSSPDNLISVPSPSTFQKRKVGRPRKYPNDQYRPTETLVAKKPKLSNSGSIVGLILSNEFQNIGSKKMDARKKMEKSKLKHVPVTSSVVSTLAMLKSQKNKDSNRDKDSNYRRNRIMPKLKAEPKLKSWRNGIEGSYKARYESGRTKADVLNYMSSSISINRDRDISETESSDENISKQDDKNDNRRKKFSHKIKSEDRGKTYGRNKRITKPIRNSDSSTLNKPNEQLEYEKINFEITQEILDAVDNLPLRILIAVGGLFRAGSLSAVRPPDLYGIKLDGERGNRTHIYTKEEILRNMVLEVKTRLPLKSGTRICAYWSSQYLSLYPGTVVTLSSSEESEDEDFTSVEFDDGDSGRINVHDIRLLPLNFVVPQNYKLDPAEYGNDKRKRVSTSSYDGEIPVDKQLHSPESPTLSRDHKSVDEKSDVISTKKSTDLSSLPALTDQMSDHNEENDKKREKLSSTSSVLSSSGDYTSSSTISVPVTTTDSNSTITSSSSSPVLSVESNDGSSVTRDSHFISTNGSRENKRVKKKHRCKDRDGSPSRRRSHKHRTESSEEGCNKSHKRHKRKHRKHRRHHKHRHASLDSKYSTDISTENSQSVSGAKNIDNDNDITVTSRPVSVHSDSLAVESANHSVDLETEYSDHVFENSLKMDENTDSKCAEIKLTNTIEEKSAHQLNASSEDENSSIPKNDFVDKSGSKLKLESNANCKIDVKNTTEFEYSKPNCVRAIVTEHVENTEDLEKKPVHKFMSAASKKMIHTDSKLKSEQESDLESVEPDNEDVMKKPTNHFSKKQVSKDTKSTQNNKTDSEFKSKESNKEVLTKPRYTYITAASKKKAIMDLITEEEPELELEFEESDHEDIPATPAKNYPNSDLKLLSEEAVELELEFEESDEEGTNDMCEKVSAEPSKVKPTSSLKPENKDTKNDSTISDNEDVAVDKGKKDGNCKSSSESNNGLWDWHGKGVKRSGKGRAKKEFFKAIKRSDEIISIGDCAVFLTASDLSRPFIGRIESLWECSGNMTVKVNWFYHPEETTGFNEKLPYLGALFESPHTDINDVQTIAHKCEVVSIGAYKTCVEENPTRLHNIANNLYYLAGRYDPTNKRLTFEKGVI